MTARALGGPAILLAIAVAIGLTGSEVWLDFIAGSLIAALAAQGWNILGGLAGQLSFGQAAYFGAGAYVSAVLQLRYGLNAWGAAAIGIAMGAAVGAVTGFLAFRAGLRGSYFALITLAFAEVLRIGVNAAPMTGGAAGLLLPLAPRLDRLQFADRALFCALALACVAAAYGLTRAVAASRFGAQLAAVRENEDAARALGIDALRTKLGAAGLSAAITATAGVMYLQYHLFINADLAFGVQVSVAALLAPIVGGAGTAVGPLLGAFALHGLGELTRLAAGPAPGIDQALFGLLLVAAIAFAPGGLAGRR